MNPALLEMVLNLFARIFTARDAQTIYSDIIRPRLAALEKKVKFAKRDLLSKPLRTSLIAIGSLSFGLYSGLIPPVSLPIFKAGATVVGGGDFIRQLFSLGEAEKSVRNDNLYFLWKVKRMSKGKA